MADLVLLRTPQAASLLGVSISTLEHMRSYGIGPDYIRVGRQVRYRVADVHAFLDANTVSTRKQM